MLVMTLDLALPGCRSLKARRAALEPLKNRLRRDLNLSVSEVAPRDVHDRARLGIAAVVDDRSRGDAQYERILAMLARDRRCLLIDEEKEYW